MTTRLLAPPPSASPIGPGARCCWCQQPLEWLTGAWWCQTEACRTKQAEYALAQTDAKGRVSRWLFVPTPKQVEFQASPAKNRLFGGAAMGAKSHAIRWGMYRRALTIQGYEGLLLRRTYPELQKTHLRRMERDAPLLGAVYHKSDKLLEFPATGSLIEAGHLDDEDALSKHLSTDYDEINADEGSTFDGPRLLELSTRARSNKPAVQASGGAKFGVGTNPGGPAWPMLRDFFIHHSPDLDRYPQLKTKYDPAQWVYIKALLDDNPYRDPDYETSLAVLHEARYRQLRWGDEDVFDGAMFAEWRESKDGQPYHVQRLEIDPTSVDWICGCDWGYNAPFVCAWYACLPDGHYYRRREWKDSGLSAEDFAKGFWKITREELGIQRPRYVVADPSIRNKTGAGRGESVLETLQAYGLPMRCGDNDRVNGWYRVHELLRPAPDGQPWLIVDPSCSYLRRTIGNAPQDPKNPEDIESTYADDHALDELRYLAMSRPSPSAIVRTRPMGGVGKLLQQAMLANGPAVLGSDAVRRAG